MQFVQPVVMILLLYSDTSTTPEGLPMYDRLYGTNGINYFENYNLSYLKFRKLFTATCEYKHPKFAMHILMTMPCKKKLFSK